MERHLAMAMLVVALLVGPAALAAPPGAEGAFHFRLGGYFPSGDGSFWEANESTFTLDASDFNGPIGGCGYVASINNFVEFGIGIDLYSEAQRAAYREFTDQFGNPIFHDTRLALAPVSADLRILPAGRFKRTGADGRRLVRRPVPYIGAGVGLLYWDYEEVGDFIASDLSIVYDRLTDSGLDSRRTSWRGSSSRCPPSGICISRPVSRGPRPLRAGASRRWASAISTSAGLRSSWGGRSDSERPRISDGLSDEGGLREAVRREGRRPSVAGVRSSASP